MQVMTPILLQQFRLFYAKDRPLLRARRPAPRRGVAARKQDAGVVLWAFVDADTETRLAAGATKLRPQDWKSGDRLWVVEVIAPFGGAEEMIKDLKQKVFPTQDVRFVAVSKDGKKEVRVV